jgi:hypothetical protein
MIFSNKFGFILETVISYITITNRGQLCKSKQIKSSEEKNIDRNGNDVKASIIIKLQKHLFIVKKV